MSGNFLAEKYSRNEFVSFLSHGFLPDDFVQTKSSVAMDKTNYIIKDATRIGSCPSLGLSVYEVKHGSNHDPRVTLSRESFNILGKNDVEPNALAVFFNEDTAQWRLSLITSDYTLGKKKGQVNREFSNPRRFSYLLGENCKLHTPEAMLVENGRVKSADDLVSRFAIEVVTRKFYRELFRWYDAWAVNLVKFPQGKGASTALPQKPDAEKNRQHLIRLITRLIFVWFLKQKDNLVPDWIFDKDEISKVLKNFDASSEEQGNYYNGVIQNLFFATLNKPIQERIFANTDKANMHEDYRIKTKFRDFNGKSLFTDGYNPVGSPKKYIDLFNQIPFLNGGLFECLDNFDTQEYEDGFSRENKRAAFVPNCLFWGDNQHEGLIPFLSRYNFTIEENTPQDIDIALDPELLGKVFENLLGTYNAETRETARNESGSFYTPREIVDYMVDSSLKEYFKGKLNSKDGAIEKKLDKLFCYHEDGHDFGDEVPDLMKAINECKILDPACGSGAFPMGILNRLAFIMQKLDPKNEIWRQIQIEKATKATGKAYGMGDVEKRNESLNKIKAVFDMSTGEYSNYARKLFLIENCIYGVDIQPIAIQISKLRFFISLIADQKTDENKERNYNVLPLPNLETKFVVANTLIGLKGKQGDLVDRDVEKKQEELMAIQHDHFSVQDAKEKTDLRKQDATIRKELAKLLKEGGIFGTAEADRLSKWNPYKQMEPAAFFDPSWMFGLPISGNDNGVFDIVIGNPPYIQLQNNRGELANAYAGEKYDCFSRSGDIYQLFYERSYDLLKNNGFLCFITSNKWMRAAYGEKTRAFFASKANPKILIDFAGQRVFESVTVDVNIILIAKDKNEHATLSCIIKEDCKNNMTDYIRQHGNAISFPSNGQSWVILSDIEMRIKEKIEKIGKPLKDWDISIYRGILTGCNEAFIINKEKCDELIKKDGKSAEIIRPILRGRDIARYKINYSGMYLINTHNGIPSKNIPPVAVEKYPAVKKHLDKHWEKIERREDQGITPYNLRSCVYMDDFSKQKIIYPDIMRMPRNSTLLGAYPYFYLDNNNFYVEATNFILTGNNIELIFLFLTSDIGFYVFSKFYSGPQFDGTGFRYKKEYINNLFIPIISQKDNRILTTCFNEHYPDAEKIDKVCEEVFMRTIGLDKDEMKIIKNYKLSLLLAGKT